MIEVIDVWKAFDGHQVLKGLSLTIKNSETLVILGRSGVGKSVLHKKRGKETNVTTRHVKPN